jgi:hypothetical protein
MHKARTVMKQVGSADGEPGENEFNFPPEVLVYLRADEEASEHAGQLHVDASSDLESFHISPNRAGSYKIAPIINNSAAGDVANIARLAFFGCTALCDDDSSVDRLDRCRSVLHLARVEALRLAYKESYWAGALILAGVGNRRFGDKERATAKKMMDADRYRNGDAYCKGGATSSPSVVDPDAHTFIMWVEHTSEGDLQDYQRRWPCSSLSPLISSAELIAGLALVLIDAAAARPFDGLRKIAVAAELLAYSNGTRSYLDAMAHEASEKRKRAVRAVSVRHAPGNKERDQLITFYKENSTRYRSKDAAAKDLSERFNVAFSTARDYLKGV